MCSAASAPAAANVLVLPKDGNFEVGKVLKELHGGIIENSSEITRPVGVNLHTI